MSDYVKDLINNIADGNLESAEQDFNAAFSDKVSSALENIRVSVASKLTGTTNEETQLDEGMRVVGKRSKGIETAVKKIAKD